jgi:hypothetical protein
VRPLLLVALLLFAAGCGSTPKDLSLNVTWTFVSGDCASNSVQTIRVKWGVSGGVKESVDFACTAGMGKLGELSPMGGTYGLNAEGLDSGGIVRVISFGTSLTVGSGGTVGTPVDLTLNPKPADVTVTWRLSNGSGCPSGVQLPYYITLYKPAATDGGTLTNSVKEVQESCVTRTATLESVIPGDYVVELDSRAVTPKVRGTKAITVKAGENQTVDFQF